MPIVSRQLDYARPQRDGTVEVRERLTDHAGQDYYFSYRAASQATAAAMLAARDMTAVLNDAEEQRLRAHVERTGTVAGFSFVEMTQAEGRRRVLRRFMAGDVRTDRVFLCSIAAYVAGFTAAQIAAAASITLTQANKVRSRAVRLRDTICPALSADDGEVQA